VKSRLYINISVYKIEIPQARDMFPESNK